MINLSLDLIEVIPPLYSTENISFKEKEIIFKFFNPEGFGSWYVIEGQKMDNDYVFFGLIDLMERELGYFSLKELSTLKLKYGQNIEIDSSFEKTQIKNIQFEN